jgi:hypothetical protein
MSRIIALCGLGVAAEGEVCGAPAAYRIEARSANNKRCSLTLCSEHVHRAWHLAQMIFDRRYAEGQIKVRSIHLHQLNHPPKAEAASMKTG